jgi:excisionase family DNA binding protein
MENITTNYSREELKEILREIVNETDKEEEEIMTIDEVNRFTRIPKPTLYDYTHKGKIPCSKVGKKLLFIKSEIMAWIKAHRNQPAQAGKE